jgi:hypothetical protein
MTEGRENRLKKEELERCLSSPIIKKLLRGSTGSFSIRYLFINEYINYINQQQSNSKYMPVINPPGSFNPGSLATLAKRIIGRKRCEPVDILFISRNRQVKVKVGSRYVVGDYIFYSIIDELMRKHPEYRIHMFILDDSYDKYNYLTMSNILEAAYVSLKVTKSSYYRGLFLADQNFCNCGHVASYFFHPRIFLRNVLLGYSLEKMIEMLRPKVIITNDDCIYTKPLGSKAKTIVMQSARVAEYLEEYRKYIFYDPELKPDFFLSSGMVYSKIKEDIQAAKSVQTTGLPRYDVLFYASEIYSKLKFFQRYNLNPDHRIVYWSTQCHVLSDKENAANFKSVFGALKQLKNVTLVIKQHPAEDESYTQAIRKHMDDFDINAIITPRDSDTYEQLFICDLMITKASTTAMEAVALRKPVVILNLSGEPDFVEYVREGVALGVYEARRLLPAIEQLLDSDSDQAANRDRYIEKYLYKVDGRATERVVEIITRLCSNASLDD